MEEDRQLVVRCLAGDASAFHVLVERHQESVYRVVYRFLGNHHDALEVAQETFARAFEKLAGFDLSRPFAVWLLSIGSNLSRDILRKRVRRRTVLSDELLAGVPGGEPPETPAARREEAERLRRAVATLDPDKRVAVVLRYFEGKSLAEISEITGAAVNTLKVRLHRARKELMGKLEGE